MAEPIAGDVRHLDAMLAPFEQPYRLNLGCGWDHRDGYIDVDVDPVFEPDLVLDLSQRPWPLPDRCAEEVIMRNVLEHMDDPVAVAREIHRILVPGGRWVVRVPHKDSRQAVGDWTHKTFWTRHRMEWITDPNRGGWSHAGDVNFELVKLEGGTRLSKFKHLRGWREWWNWFECAPIEAVYVRADPSDR